MVNIEGVIVYADFDAYIRKRNSLHLYLIYSKTGIHDFAHHDLDISERIFLYYSIYALFFVKTSNLFFFFLKLHLSECCLGMRMERGKYKLHLRWPSKWYQSDTVFLPFINVFVKYKIVVRAKFLWGWLVSHVTCSSDSCNKVVRVSCIIISYSDSFDFHVSRVFHTTMEFPNFLYFNVIL